MMIVGALNGGLRNRPRLWCVAKTLAKFVFKLSTGFFNHGFADFRARVAVYLLTA